jgi:hypothetical protein
MMNVAKVNKKTGIVENIEVASEQWIEENTPQGYTYVVIGPSEVAHIGLSWSKENGFEQP